MSELPLDPGIAAELVAERLGGRVAGIRWCRQVLAHLATTIPIERRCDCQLIAKPEGPT